MEKLKLEETYEGGLSASIDWVAGGNFDGYVYRKTLRFSEHNIVRMNTIILDQSRYDGEAENAEMIGHYEASDHKTITCTFGDYKMRGKILGEQGAYIAFSISHPDVKKSSSECYKWSKI
jgi:hypothetical protein